METGNTARALGFAKAITNRDREAALAVCHPDIEFRSMLGIDGRSYRGHDGIREYFDDIDSAFSEWSIEVEQVVEGDDGRVAIVMTMHARGQGSGAELAGRTGHVWTLRDGRLARNQLFREADAALEALSLPPRT
jgi:ketosteroid isomerase-like protein